MTIREMLEQDEHRRLRPEAAFADHHGGRARPDAPSDVRTDFQRDCDRIAYSKSYRRLMHKTQVFLQPEGDHYRTRMTHTMEVSRIARTIARALRVNEDLTEAIALGHDLGHTPFGHAGEAALNEILPGGFAHNEQSLRVVDRLENDGQGLNLTEEVRMGIVGHTGELIPTTWEGRIVRLSDRIAYINHDIDDAIRAGVLEPRQIPAHVLRVLGRTHTERINTLVCDVVAASEEYGTVTMHGEIRQTMEDLRDFMFANVYRNPVAKGEESKAKDIVRTLYEYYCKHPMALPPDYQRQLEREPASRIAADYIAGMTDKYAVYTFSALFIPTAWQVR